MRIAVGFDSVSEGRVFYSLTPASKKRQDYDRLVELVPRIQSMARRQLGKDLLSVSDHGNEVRLLTKVGTSRGSHRFALRELLGWIALCDVEPA